jgi:DNA-binding LacI/PurR family transcriptional regulator
VKGAHSVRLDNFSGAYKAVQYLIGKGRKKIGLISGDIAPLFEDVEVYSSAAERYEGYKKALADNNIAFDPKLIMPAHTFSYEEGKDAMDSYLDQGLKPDAILSAAGDMAAIGAIEQAATRGVKVPDDISVVGFDDLFLSRFVRPSLTTVRQPIKQMGREVFDTVIAAIEGKLKEDRDIVFDPELIIRESA